MDIWMDQLLQWLALPQHGLSTVFLVSFISATLLPLGSEPAVFGLVKLNPELFWSAVLVATAGNTLGGMVSWWMGWGAHRAVDRWRHSSSHVQALKCVPVGMVAGGGRPDLLDRRLAQNAVLAMHGVHGHW
jgi:membrane protein YqaA with SNARE-associated domain